MEASKTEQLNASALMAVKAVHTAIWFSIEAAMEYWLYAVVRGRADRKAAIASGIVAAECLVFLANGAHCPLTKVAEKLGAESGSVTDIYLPKWLARSLPVIHVPLVVIACVLHWRNVHVRTIP